MLGILITILGTPKLCFSLLLLKYNDLLFKLVPTILYKHIIFIVHIKHSFVHIEHSFTCIELWVVHCTKRLDMHAFLDLCYAHIDLSFTHMNSYFTHITIHGGSGQLIYPIIL